MSTLHDMFESTYTPVVCENGEVFEDIYLLYWEGPDRNLFTDLEGYPFFDMNNIITPYQRFMFRHDPYTYDKFPFVHDPRVTVHIEIVPYEKICDYERFERNEWKHFANVTG